MLVKQQHFPVVRSAAITVLFILLLAGRFNLDRFGVVIEGLDFLGDVRLWCLGPLTLLQLMSGLENSWSGQRTTPTYSGSTLVWALTTTALLVYMVVTMAWVPSLAGALNQMIDVFMLIFVILLTFILFRPDTEQSIRFFFLAFFCAAVVYALAGLPSVFQGTLTRLSVFGGGPNVFVRVMGTGIIAACYWWFRTAKLYWLLPVPLFIIEAVLSGSRGGVIAAMIAGSSFLLWRFSGSHRIKEVVLLSAVALGTYWLMSHSQTIVDFVSARFIVLTENLYTSHRDTLFRLAWQFFLKHPVTGIGLGGFEQLIGLYPHNLFLQIAAEGGMVGLALVSAALIQLVPRWFRPKNLEQTAAFFTGSLYLIASMFSGDLYDTRFVWVFFLLYMLPAASPSLDKSRYSSP